MKVSQSVKNKDGWSTFEAAEILGIRIERLRDWIHREFIEPDLVWPKVEGRGAKRVLSKIGLYEIKLLDHLLKRGFNRMQAGATINLVKRAMLEGKMIPEFILQYRIRENYYEAACFENIRMLQAILCELNFDEYEDVYIINFSRIKRSVDKLIE